MSINVNGETRKKKPGFLRLLFAKLFQGKKKMSILEEEQLQSPFRTVLNNFRDNKVSMSALIVFLMIFVVALVVPYFLPLDLSYSDTSQQNLPPGRNMMSYPRGSNGKVSVISTGPSFSVGASTDGKLFIWGKTGITSKIDVKYVPANMGKIVDLVAGYDHILALNDQGKLFAWGNGRQGQTQIPPDVEQLDDIREIKAGNQSSVVLSEDGTSYFFGNDMNNDYNAFHPYQGQLAQVELTSDAVLGRTTDGKAVYLGSMKNGYSEIPKNMGNVTDIAATSSTMAAVNDQGEVFVWGNISQKWKENQVPKTKSRIVALQGGKNHYTAVTEDGEVVAWGADQYHQATVPKSLQGTKVSAVYTGFFQNYAITKDGSIKTWGLKGYPLGSDEMGRDILTRLVNGGRMSIMVGGVAVIISTIIGVLIGSISGYFGGKIDTVLQRITEMIVSLPFLPFVMILSALIGNSMGSNQKVWLIMVILGLLSWPGLARLVRAQVLSVREQEYVVAARSVGVKKRNIVFKHILPNVISVILVSATLDFATCMLTEATLSFLGFGVPAPQPTWGNMLFGANSSIVIQNYWWRWVYASIVLGVCVICINLIGDGLRDAIDPKSQER